MTIRDILSSSGMTVNQLSTHLGIPSRTIQNWISKSDTSRRQCPEYVVDLIRFRLTAEGIIK